MEFFYFSIGEAFCRSETVSWLWKGHSPVERVALLVCLGSGWSS